MTKRSRDGDGIVSVVFHYLYTEGTRSLGPSKSGPAPCYLDSLLSPLRLEIGPSMLLILIVSSRASVIASWLASEGRRAQLNCGYLYQQRSEMRKSSPIAETNGVQNIAICRTTTMSRQGRFPEITIRP